MSRLERKCLVTSAGAHGMLFLLLALAPFLWRAPLPPVSLPPINFIPSRLIDGAMSGGGSPDVKEMPKQAPASPVTVPTPAPQAAPPKPVAVVQPETARPQAEPEAQPRTRRVVDSTPSEKPNVKTALAKPSDDAKPTRRKIEVAFERETATGKKTSAAQERAEAAAASAAAARAAAAQRAARIQSVLGTIGQGVSSGTSIEVPGPGGEAFADYGQWLVAIYHRAWTPPTNLANDVATVEVTVVVRRDGKVESFKVTRRSGNTALDRSVENLRRVGSIAPFPDGASDERRTFIIEFNLRSKRAFQ